MNKVLFVSPTVYSNPLTKDIQKKFQSLSNVCNPIVYAFSEEKFTSSVEGVEGIFNKKNKNRFLNYLKIIFLFIFKIPKIVNCLLYTSPSPRDKRQSRMPSSA